MHQKGIIILIGLVIFITPFYGCTGLQKDSIVKNYYDLTVKSPFFDLDTVRKGDPLLVKDFSITPAFDSHSFVYRVGEDEYKTDFYSEFVNYPAKLITGKVMEGLCASIYFSPVISSMKPDISFRLSGRITRLYGDFLNPNDPKAIIEIRIILEKRTDNTFNEILNHIYLAEEPLESQAPAHLVSGWNKALIKIVTAFIRDFKTPAP